ncbi:MAG: hypothetical protein WB561_19800 [Terracidiphilus sp.]
MRRILAHEWDTEIHSFTAMKLVFAIDTNSDAAELAELHTAAAENLTRRFGHGFWSSPPSERGILANMRPPKFSRLLIARTKGRIVGTLRIATKKPWAIDTSYFTSAAKPLYLTGMAVHPTFSAKESAVSCSKRQRPML